MSDSPKPERVLRQFEQAERMGVSRWTPRRLAASDPTYPPQRQFAPGIVGCLETEFEAWLKSRPVAGKGRARRVIGQDRSSPSA